MPKGTRNPPEQTLPDTAAFVQRQLALLPLEERLKRGKGVRRFSQRKYRNLLVP